MSMAVGGAEQVLLNDSLLTYHNFTHSAWICLFDDHLTLSAGGLKSTAAFTFY